MIFCGDFDDIIFPTSDIGLVKNGSIFLHSRHFADTLSAPGGVALAGVLFFCFCNIGAAHGRCLMTVSLGGVLLFLALNWEFPMTAPFDRDLLQQIKHI